MDTARVHPETLAGDPIAYAAAQDHDRGRPCACNSGWVTIGQLVSQVPPRFPILHAAVLLVLCPALMP